MNFPFVVQLLTSFQDEECVYFVMEFSCGGEFFRHLKARGRCAPHALCYFCVCFSTTCMHSNNQHLYLIPLPDSNYIVKHEMQL